MSTFGKAILSALMFSLSICFLTAQDTSFIFKPTFEVGGRIQYDFEALTLGEETVWKNGFRRVHFDMSGAVGTKLRYRMEVDFSRARLGFRHLFIQYKTAKIGDFTVGSMPEPTSLNMLTSSNYTTFFERAMLTNLQNFRWGAGFHYQNFQLFNNRAGIQLAYTFNGINTEGFYDDNLNRGGNIITRISGKIFEKKETFTLIHLGVNYAKRINEEAWDYQLKSRPENFTGEKVIARFDEGGMVSSRSSLGMEAAAVFGPLSIQGEYKMSHIFTDEMTFDVSAYYAFVSYFITGEHRTYKKGKFSKVVPRHSIDKGGIGAFELAVRYSVMNTSGAPTTFMDMETSGLTKDLSFGFNWYLNSYARIVYNFVYTDFGFSQPNPNHKEKAHLLRFQVRF